MPTQGSIEIGERKPLHDSVIVAEGEDDFEDFDDDDFDDEFDDDFEEDEDEFLDPDDEFSNFDEDNPDLIGPT